MKQILVMVLKGKGTHSSADSVCLHTFPNVEAAESFCEMTTDMAPKYWTHAKVIEIGVTHDTQPE